MFIRVEDQDTRQELELAQQVTESKERERKPTALLRCPYDNHIWLTRSASPVLTCSVCGNHVIVRDNTVTTDSFNQNQKQKGSSQNQGHEPEQTDNTTVYTRSKELNDSGI